MLNIELISSYPKPIWLDIFGARLLQLQPNMDASTAAEHAILVFAESALLEPDEAAEIFVAASARSGPDNRSGNAG
jgi:hypothetical protein